MTPPHSSPFQSHDSELAAQADPAERTALVPAPPATSVLPRAASDSPSPAHTHTVNTIMQKYGHELRAFLRGRTRSRVSMDEVFAVFSEDVWKGLPKLRVQSQVRAWLYAVARNALARHSKSQRRWHSRHVSGELEELQLAVRHSITGGAAALAELEPILAGFSHADRHVLEQRLVLSRAWRDIAREELSQRAQTAELADADLERECARLRKRYQLLMQQLRERMPGVEP